MNHLHQLFQEPPKQFSPVPLWWWSAERLDPARLRWQLERFVEGGIYNLCVICLAPFGPVAGTDPDDPAFLSDAWWEIFRGVCADAKELGISMWFHDQLGFAGGTLQGWLAARQPQFIGQQIQRVVVEADGPVEVSAPGVGEALVAFALPAGGAPELLALQDGRARWNGRGRVMLAYLTRRNFDYFQPAAAAALIDMVHGALERQAGQYFGSVIAGTFQDEFPSFPTWSANFACEFQHRRGYDLVGKLAALWEDVGAEAEQVRTDYQRTRAELAEEALFKPLFEWHEKHGLICGYDQMGPVRAGYPVDSVKNYADYFATMRWFGAPGNDHDGDPKIHSSMAHLYDRPRVWLEGFHSSGWGSTLEETFDWLMPFLRGGATLYDPHAVYYTTRGGWWEWAPPSTCWRQPYWRHYRHFSQAVTRLCAVLSQGDHVCDIGVLFPNATAQAGTTFDGPTPAAQRAHDIYLALVGELNMRARRPGILDGDCRDFDVLDEPSVQRGTGQTGKLAIGREAFRAIILPGCDRVAPATAEKLNEFVRAGGLLLAVDCAPAGVRCRTVAEAKDVPVALAEIPRRVEAPVPTLWRRVEGRDVLFVPITHPTVTELVGKGDGRGYQFDPAKVARTMKLTVRGVSDAAELWDPLTGTRRSLPTSRQGDVVEVEVPFDSSPVALIVFGGEPGETPAQSPIRTRRELTGDWDVTLVPTLDNRWGDFAKPNHVGAPPVQQWQFEHRVEGGEWTTVQATFGPYGMSCGPDSTEWKPVVYSLSRGIYKDTLTWQAFGPSGHVPEEFLDFGTLRTGQSVRFRTTLHSTEAGNFYLAIGAPVTKDAWFNGEALGTSGPGYLWLTPVRVRAGRNELEFVLRAEGDDFWDVWGRAYYAIVRNSEAFVRPEAMILVEEPRKDAIVVFSRRVELKKLVKSARVLVDSTVPTQIFVNGTQIGLQGGFEPYETTVRTLPYDITASLRVGDNLIEIKMAHTQPPIVLMIDGWFDGQLAIQSEASGWNVQSDGVPVGYRIRRLPNVGGMRNIQDPAHYLLRRRPHPLPATDWLEDQPADNTVVRVVPDAFEGQQRVEWFRFLVPPGATEMMLPIAGAVTGMLDDEKLSITGARIALPNPGKPTRMCELRVVPAVECSGGGVFRGPVTFEVGRGRMALGDWTKLGLSTHSGGVTYSRVIQADGQRAVLDLGRVRGTAEVRVNGKLCGVRLWSPYRFEISDALRPGENQIEITVFNTLGPYFDAVSPTGFVYPGQHESGVFGPVYVEWVVAAMNE